MATIGAIGITESWTKIYDGLIDGVFCGGIQSLGAGITYVRVQTGDASPNNLSGFMLGSDIYPIKVLATESLWARASSVSGSVILG